ncbi:MAG: hypothetical protein J0I06_23425, partial [Planctomycetes bacterium]|nr:hypothetical protein [Planctomycetota bacterium]
MADNRRTLLGWVWPPPPIAGRLWVAVAAAAGYSALVWAVEPKDGLLQPLWSSQFALFNTAILGLLVSFRTKVAYDRWWEGRVLWGALVNNSRNLCLKVLTLAKPDATERAAFAALVTAFPVALMRHLRGPLRLNELDDFKEDDATPEHIPAHIAGRLMAAVAAWRTAGRIDGHAHQMLDANL